MTHTELALLLSSAGDGALYLAHRYPQISGMTARAARLHLAAEAIAAGYTPHSEEAADALVADYLRVTPLVTVPGAVALGTVPDAIRALVVRP